MQGFARAHRTLCHTAMGLEFIWPALLWTVLLVPLLAALYLRVFGRRPRHPVFLSTTGTLIAAGRRDRLRHVPAVLLGAALVALLISLARPVLPLPVPVNGSAIMLAIDISGSMRSTDIAPSRLDAAKAAAKTFLRSLPAGVRVGLVVFAGYAALLAPPGMEHTRIEELIDGFSTARRTAIGDGLIEAVAALPGRVRPDPDGTLPRRPAATLPTGIVVLLSDGRSNAGMDPLQAAEIAAEEQVTVHTVGVGQPVTPNNSWTIGGPLDEETLQAIATRTGGTYFQASSAQGLHEIYRRLARSLGWEHRPTEVSALAAGIAAVLLIAALAVSWRRIPLAT